MARPTVMTPETIVKLEELFLRGYNDLESCKYARISKSCLYDFQKKNPWFSDKKTLLKSNLKLRAKIVLFEKIQNGCISSSKWLLEKKSKEFSRKKIT